MTSPLAPGPAVPDHRHDGERIGELNDRHKARRERVGMDMGPTVGVIQAVEIRLTHVFATEGLDHAPPRNRLREISGHRRDTVTCDAIGYLGVTLKTATATAITGITANVTSASLGS